MPAIAYSVQNKIIFLKNCFELNSKQFFNLLTHIDGVIAHAKTKKGATQL